MPSKELQAFLDNFPECMMDATDPLDVVRAKMDAIHPKTHASDTMVERVVIAGVHCAWISVPETNPSRACFSVMVAPLFLRVLPITCKTAKVPHVFVEHVC